MKLFEAINNHPSAAVFRRISARSSNHETWEFHPVEGSTLKNGGDDYFVIKALQVISQDEIVECYMDMSMPERLADFAFFLRDGELDTRSIYQCRGKVIPAIAIEKFGVYEQFYCKSCPEVGLNVLRKGLSVAEIRWPIAVDMGYILRDEGRHDEAIDAFSMAIDEGETDNPFYYEERAQLYDKRGDTHKGWEDRNRSDAIQRRLGFRI